MCGLRHVNAAEVQLPLSHYGRVMTDHRAVSVDSVAQVLQVSSISRGSMSAASNHYLERVSSERLERVAF